MGSSNLSYQTRQLDMLDKHNDDYQTLGLRYCISQEGIELLIKSLENFRKIFAQITEKENNDGQSHAPSDKAYQNSDT